MTFRSCFPGRWPFFALCFAFLAISFIACQKEEFLPVAQEDEEDLSAFFSQNELADIAANTCLTEDPIDPDHPEILPPGAADDRATGLKNKFWTPGQTLRVRFLNGNATLQNKVMNYAKQWEGFANIKFTKVISGTSEIRIAFDNAGHWSYVGKDNLSIPQNQKTMNLQFTGSTAEIEIRRTTLHEFGHALGLGHEHQNPTVSIQWKIPAVYAYYAQMGWSQQKVNEQVLTKYQWAQTQHTNHDSKSIMQYPVPASLTTNGVSIPWNSQLSATDKDFIGKMYSSQRIRVRHAANTGAKITFALNGIYYTLSPGESVMAPAKTSGNQLGIWECIGSNSTCAWDNAYTPLLNVKYRIISSGAAGNLTLAVD